MATRRKTIEYWFPPLTTAADNTKTALTQITAYIPEAASGTITFMSVQLHAVIADNTATPADVTSRSLFCTIQGASENTVTNSNTMTQAGENFCHSFSVDVTGYFTSNWGSNASRTLDCSITVNTGTGGSNNIGVKVVIDYEFDDTQTTHVKTVYIPLDSNPLAQAASKPGSATATIPLLDDYCPEDSTVFRQMTIVVQGNNEIAAATGTTISWEIDSAGAFTTQTLQNASDTSSWLRANQTVSFTTSATHSFYLWASTTDWDHLQVWLVVTYEFVPGSSSRMLNSLILPMDFDGPMGGTASTDYQRSSINLWIEEPGTINNTQIAGFLHWDQPNNITSVLARAGTGSFVTYSSVATTVSGGCGLMIRNDSAFTLARGKNTLTCDIYRTDSIDLGSMLCGWWIINYHSDIPTQGFWAANNTIQFNARPMGTTALATSATFNVTPNINESSYFLNSVGVVYQYISNSTVGVNGGFVGIERLTTGGEGGNRWEPLSVFQGFADSETGIRTVCRSTKEIFTRWADSSVVDPGPGRLPFETLRRWYAVMISGATALHHLDVLWTFHSITFAVTGTISGSAGGTVTLALHRESDGEKLMSTTRSGNGSYTFNWFDNTENVYVVATETSTLRGVSKDAVASSGDFNISLGNSFFGQRRNQLIGR